MEIIQDYCTGNSRYQAADPLSPRGIVLHSIGCPQPSAEVLHNMWANNGSPYMTHYNVDDHEAYHNMPDDRKCWHVGGPGNAYWLGCEMGEPAQIHYTSGASFEVDDLDAAQTYCRATYNNAVELFSKICTEHGWNPMTDIWTHGEITRQHLSNTDHVDPEHLWRGLGLDYTLDSFRRDVQAAMGAEPAPADDSQIYRIRQSWEDAASQVGAYHSLDNAVAACPDGYGIYDSDGNRVGAEAEAEEPAEYIVRVTAGSGLNVRGGPGIDYSVQMAVPYGGSYTITEERNGWGRLKSGAGWICLDYTDRV